MEFSRNTMMDQGNGDSVTDVLSESCVDKRAPKLIYMSTKYE